MLVVKLGGTTVRYGREKILKKIYNLEYNRLVIVVSALSEITDLLLEGDIEKVRNIHYEMTSNPKTRMKIDKCISEYVYPTNPKMVDKALSCGELMSMHLFSEFLDMEHVCIPSHEFIKTDDTYTDANVDYQETKTLINKMFFGVGCSRVILTTGFIGGHKNEITTLGRGGSDFTASIIGSITEADRIIIYTDVDGLMTSDPKTDKKAKLIRQITYKDAMVMSKNGAKVLYHKTIDPLIGTNIKLLILNTFSERCDGTVISDGYVF